MDTVSYTEEENTKKCCKQKPRGVESMNKQDLCYSREGRVHHEPQQEKLPEEEFAEAKPWRKKQMTAASEGISRGAAAGFQRDQESSVVCSTKVSFSWHSCAAACRASSLSLFSKHPYHKPPKLRHAECASVSCESEIRS